MTATPDDIERWIAEGQKMGATHVVIVYDTWDHGNFPLFVMPGEDAHVKFTENYRTKPGECAYKADECYCLLMDIDRQLNERRANHWGLPRKKKK
tara:strand:- start:178 stop:462 length:285 start_codon:yes stop_codon:yes gene_type:complete